MDEANSDIHKTLAIIPKLLAMRKEFVLASFLSALMLLSITPLQSIENNQTSTFEISQSSGRSETLEGDWAAHRQLRLEYRYGGCGEYFALDQQNNYLAIYDCQNTINIYHNSDWSILIDTIELGITYIENLDFSPNGEYLIATSGAQFEIYQTSDWKWVYSNDVNPDDGSQVSIYDFSWSGDGQRLVFSTGNSGGDKMFEGPDWSTAAGPASSGFYVAHHPSEDIVWYVSSDGSGNEYEFENIPLVGYQWVMKRSFNVNRDLGPLTSSPDGTQIMVSGYQVSIYSSSNYAELFVSSEGGYTAAFSSDGGYIIFQENEHYNIYSTNTWHLTTAIAKPEPSCWWDDVIKIEFSANDSEILVATEQCWSGEFLIGWMPDDDSDGVVNQQDICPDSPEEEAADVKGCAASQKDTDLDGVNDRDDECPRTSTSDSVNSMGCSVAQLTDSDDDGVSDSDDLCPNTSSSEFSNIYGCSSSQRDVDGDGIVDSLDNCPLYDIEDCPSVFSWVTSTEPANGSENLINPKWSPAGDLVSAFDTDSENIFILDESLSFVEEIFLQNQSQEISTYSWDSNGEWLMVLWHSSSWQNSICGYYIWYAANQSLSPSYQTSNNCDFISSHAISPDGTRLAISQFSYDSYSGETKMFEIFNNMPVFVDEDHHPRDLMFSHDGVTLIGLNSREIILWDVNAGYFLQSKSVDYIDSMLLSPDGDSLYTWYDEQIMVYSLNTLELKSTTNVEGETDTNDIMISLTFSRNNQLLYVSWLERIYDQGIFYNSTIQTYQVTSNQSLELIATTDAINETYRTWPAISPDESSVLVPIRNVSNSGYERGFYLWESDSDGDKIADSLDLCQNTILNETPDQTGCSWGQKDDDEDGVTNNQDFCTNTSTGNAMGVDQAGCSDQQVDEDSDGICDENAPSDGPSNCLGKDICPSTILGKIVDGDGCSWEQQDDDYDSVQNGIDICPDTNPAETVDSVGCGPMQRDSDADSVNDYWDLCASTGNNSTADEAGCSDIQVDADLDNVCNSNAKSAGPSNCTRADFCPDTVSNATVDGRGCSWNQRDDDADGVSNQLDSCPDSQSSDVSTEGCSIWQLDSDNDGVSDALDECANTPEGESSNQVGCSQSQVKPKSALAGVADFSTKQWVMLASASLAALLLSGLLIMRKKSGESENKTKNKATSLSANQNRSQTAPTNQRKSNNDSTPLTQIKANPSNKNITQNNRKSQTNSPNNNNSLNKTQPNQIQAPPYAMRGAMSHDGLERIEFPSGSGNRFYREPSTGQWSKAD